LYCINVKVENSIQEHFIEYSDIVAVWEERKV
jgi:hypothetical protein